MTPGLYVDLVKIDIFVGTTTKTSTLSFDWQRTVLESISFTEEVCLLAFLDEIHSELWRWQPSRRGSWFLFFSFFFF